jgi:hypothetical protein
MPQLQPFWDDNYNVANPGPYYAPGEENGEPFCAPNSWDTALLAGIQAPGIVSVTPARAQDIDIKKAIGAPPVLTLVGYTPLRFAMSILIWTPAQWVRLQQIMWALQPVYQKPPASNTIAGIVNAALPATKTRSANAAFDVYHPLLAAHSIAQAVCLRLGPMTGGREKTLAIELLEKRNNKNAVHTIDFSSQVVPSFNQQTLASQNVQGTNGQQTTFTPTQGPQVPPSQGEVTLTPTP